MAQQREARVYLEARQTLDLRRLQGREEISRPFRYDLVLLGPSHDLDLDKLLATGITVEIEGTDGRRHLHGLIADVAYRGEMEDQARYDVMLVPWLWFLDRRLDCRIFQKMTAVQIVKDVVAAHHGELEDHLTGQYAERDYCVQYRESDLNFVCRLLEEEGIFFYFEHSRGRHTMMLVDEPSQCTNRPGYSVVPFYPPFSAARRERDHLYRWEMMVRARTAQTALRSFDFKQPARALEAGDGSASRHDRDNLEAYDYPGGFVSTDAGDARARIRLEELRAERRRVFAVGNATGLACGHRFTPRNFPRADQNVEHLIVAIDTTLEIEPQRTVTGDGEDPYECAIEAVVARVPFRPARLTPRPFVHGPQTAIVTGPAGEEIYTDKYGRVKVQFHWDRQGKSDANTSCWLRVSQAWAGAGFGAIHIPRVGQEVIVDFLEGDPDQPIITGRVYNAARTVPYGLPANATQSGVKSNSSKGGGGSNELRFEDKAGQEQVYLHAQKDQVSVVEHDKAETVHRNETIRIDVDRTESVGHDEALSVTNNRTRNVGVNEAVTVGTNQAVTVGANQTVTVGANQTVTINANRMDTVLLNEARTVGVAQQMTIGAARNVTVGAVQAHEIGADDTWMVGGSRSVLVSGDNMLEVAGKRGTAIGADDALQVSGGLSVTVDKAIAVVAADEILFKTGDAMLVLKKDGEILIKGKDIKVHGSGQIEHRADGNIVQKGQKIMQN